ncbi:hypothetical protein ACVWYH_006037 [Bradyrhizobium sp. GM24.11]
MVIVVGIAGAGATAGFGLVGGNGAGPGPRIAKVINNQVHELPAKVINGALKGSTSAPYTGRAPTTGWPITRRSGGSMRPFKTPRRLSGRRVSF